MAIKTGTGEIRTEQSKTGAVASVVIALGVPALLTLLGLSIMGFGAISWAGAIVWGVVAALVMWGFMTMGQRMGMTHMDLPNLLGSMFAEPRTSTSQGIGLGIHLTIGALLAISWAYTTALFAWPATWLSAMVWAMFVSLLAILLISSMMIFHPKIRAGAPEVSGPAGADLGATTTAIIVVAHLLYGFVLGLMYQIVPFA